MVGGSDRSDESGASDESARADGPDRPVDSGSTGSAESRDGRERDGEGVDPVTPSGDRFEQVLPKYLREGLAKQDLETLETARDYVDALIERRERPVQATELPENATPVSETSDGYIVAEYVKCGKDNCACASGAESDMHGPYEYRYYRDDSGTLHKEYADNE